MPDGGVECKIFWHLEYSKSHRILIYIQDLIRINLNLQIDIIPLKNSSFDLPKQDSRILFTSLRFWSMEVQATTGSWISFSLKPYNTYLSRDEVLKV